MDTLCNDGNRLRDTGLRFLESGWLQIALSYGWDAKELWGVLPGPMAVAIAPERKCLDALPSGSPETGIERRA